MRGLPKLAILAAMAPGCATVSQKQEAAREVERIMQSYAEAYASNDVANLQRLRDEGFTFTSSQGVRLTGAAELADIKSGASRSEGVELTHIDVALYGNTAVVTCDARMKGTWRGQPYGGDFALTAVWVRSSKGWRIVSEHASRRSA